MKKLDIINRLRESKKAHMTWVSHAHALVEGLAVDEDKVPVHGTECNFGGWYYGDGQVLSQLQEFQLIEGKHPAHPPCKHAAAYGSSFLSGSNSSIRL